MFGSIIALFTATLLATVAFVNAMPLHPVELLVWSPRITSPNNQTTWAGGSKQNVTWDTSDIPASKINDTGLILIGHQDSDSENLDINSPLGVNFPINAGWFEVTVPTLNVSRNNSIIVLFGDSGNASPQFKTIPNPKPDPST